MPRPKIYKNVNDMEKDIDNYFKICDMQEKPYTMSGLAYALDMDRKSLYNYSKDDKFFPTIKKAKEKVEQQLEENALMGKSNSTFTIFNLKNNFDWKDKVEHTSDDFNEINKNITNIANLLNNPKKNRNEEDV